MPQLFYTALPNADGCYVYHEFNLGSDGIKKIMYNDTYRVFSTYEGAIDYAMERDAVEVYNY